MHGDGWRTIRTMVHVGIIIQADVRSIQIRFVRLCRERENTTS